MKNRKKIISSLKTVRRKDIYTLPTIVNAIGNLFNSIMQHVI